MNRFNPKKLLHSKWTAVKPQDKERHFLVTEFIKDENDQLVAIDIEAILTHKHYQLDWRDLKDKAHWMMGWK